jgi:hypothetical protein
LPKYKEVGKNTFITRLGIFQIFVPRDCFQNVEDFGRKQLRISGGKRWKISGKKSKGIRGKMLEDFCWIEEFFLERISRGISSRIFETNNLRFLEEKVGWFLQEKLGDQEKKIADLRYILLVDM